MTTQTTRWPLAWRIQRGIAIGDLPWQRRYRKWDEWPNVEPHNCHFCGDYVIHGYESNGARHYLSDCRPDLVQHEPGPLCTWSYRDDPTDRCYAYQNRDTDQWGEQHIHFYEDGPM